MDIAAYAIESQVEQTHWWFYGRRKLFARILENQKLPKDVAILDVGTSSGTNLRMLAEQGFTRVEGLDMSPEAVRFCAEKGFGKVNLGSADAMPFADNSFDQIIATDIIEHVDNDPAALREMYRCLKPGARVLITVPAFMSLWGLQDTLAHHKRRYRKPELTAKIEAAGLRVETAYYFNFLLAAPIWLARQILKAIKPDIQSENEINNPVINAVLKAIFLTDVALAPIVRPPFGVSILCVARKPG